MSLKVAESLPFLKLRNREKAVSTYINKNYHPSPIETNNQTVLEVEKSGSSTWQLNRNLAVGDKTLLDFHLIHIDIQN